MLLASAVVVWEWLNEHGRWRPYSPAVCHHIEAVIQSDPRCGSVILGQVDSRLSPYIIDLHSMHQFRQDTGEAQRRATVGGAVTWKRGRPFYFFPVSLHYLDYTGIFFLHGLDILCFGALLGLFPYDLHNCTHIYSILIPNIAFHLVLSSKYPVSI